MYTVVETINILLLLLLLENVSKLVRSHHHKTTTIRFLKMLNVCSLRLTPPYMLVLMVATVLWPYFSQGALFMNPNEDTHPQMKWCRDNWWVNLLYVNNYVRTNETVSSKSHSVLSVGFENDISDKSPLGLCK